MHRARDLTLTANIQVPLQLGLAGLDLSNRILAHVPTPSAPSLIATAPLRARSVLWCHRCKTNSYLIETAASVQVNSSESTKWTLSSRQWRLKITRSSLASMNSKTSWTAFSSRSQKHQTDRLSTLRMTSEINLWTIQKEVPEVILSPITYDHFTYPIWSYHDMWSRSNTVD